MSLMSLSEQFFKYFTGTKTPDTRRLIEAIIIALIIFILGFLGNIALTKLLLEKSDAFVSFESLDKDEIGYFFPVNLINSGQKDLTNVELNLKTCYMDKSKLYGPYDKIVKTDNKPIKFRDQESFNLLQKKRCDPDLNFSFTNCEIVVYKLNDTDLYAPPQICSVYICDICNLTANLTAEQFSQSQMFYSRFYGPKEIRLNITPETLLDVNVYNLEKYSPVKLSWFNEREFCIWEGNCSIGKIKQLPAKYFLPELPVYMTLNPNKPYNQINLTVTYLDLDSLLKKW